MRLVAFAAVLPLAPMMSACDNGGTTTTVAPSVTVTTDTCAGTLAPGATSHN